MRINKAGKSKTELLSSLEGLKEQFRDEISEYNINISNIDDGYKIKAEKKILFISFWIDANITAGDGYYDVTWDTNAPEGKVNPAIDKVKSFLDKI